VSEGSLPVPAVRVNQRTVLVNTDAVEGSGRATVVCLYVPVSSMISKMVWAVRWRRCRSGQRMWFSCGACVEAVGSGMNGARSKVQRRWLIHGWPRW
jgi:putative resolvase